MSTVIDDIRIGTITEIEKQFNEKNDDKEVIHITTWEVFPKAICGANDCGHHATNICSWAGKPVKLNESSCPGCGKEICSFCRLLNQK